MLLEKRVILVLLLVCAGLFGGRCDTAQAFTADEVLQKVEDRYIGKTSRAAMEMILVDAKGGKRVRQMMIYRCKKDSDNKDNFIHFLNPPDIKNTSYLVNEVNRNRDKRIYLSAFKKIRKIAAEDYNMAFVASDFTYEDMDDVRASDYKCTNLREEKLDGKDVYVIDCSKKDDKTSYAGTTLFVDKQSFVVLKVLMFDKKDPAKLIKEMCSSDLKDETTQDGSQVIVTPYRVNMRDLRSNTSTTLEIKKIAYDIDLDAKTFTERNMEK